MKTKLLSFLVVLMAFVMVANAQDLVIADFEDKIIGDTRWIIALIKHKHNTMNVSDVQ